MSSLGIFDKETKTYKKVADLSKPAVIDSSMSSTSTNAVQNKVVKSYVDTRTTVDTGMSDTSTNPVQNKAVKSYVDGRTALDTSMSDTSTKAVQNKVVKSYVDTRTTFDTAMSDTSTNAVQNKIVKSYVDGRTALDTSMSDSSTKAVQNKVVKSYVDGTFKRKVLAEMPADGKTSYCQLCTIEINQPHINRPIEITVQERFRATLDRLTVLFASSDNNDPNIASFNVFGDCSEWYISKRAASTWVIYGTKYGGWSNIVVVDYVGVGGINVTWDVTGVTALPDSKTKAVWGGNVSHAVSADSASSASTVNGHTVNSDVPSGAKFTDTTYGDATTSAHGLMTPAMVSKLNGIAEGANRTTVDDALSSTSTNPVQNKVVKDEFDKVNSNLDGLGYGDNGAYNLIIPTLQTTTVSGVTCTANGDGTYTLNGTSNSSDEWKLLICSANVVAGKQYKIVGTKNPYSNNYWLKADTSNVSEFINNGIFTASSNIENIYIKFSDGITFNNEVVRPMLTENIYATYDDFKPYIPSVKMLAEEKADKSETTVNILNPTLQTTTVSGVTCTANGDGTYTLNGTNAYTDPIYLTLNGNLKDFTKKMVNKEFKLVGCPINGSSAKFNLQYEINGSALNGGCYDFGDGGVAKNDKIASENIENAAVFIVVRPGYTVDNIVFKPMLTTNLSATYDDFVPYTGDTGKLNGDVAELNKTVDTLKKSVSDGKTTVANAITAKGITTATDATFATMAGNISKITTGVDTSDATATAAQILTGQTAYVSGSKVTGTMADNGAKTASLNCGGSYTIPAGYHNGSGKVTANSLASQTNATATAAQILTGKTAYVSGEKVTGTMPDNGAKTASLNCGGSYAIPAGYHNGSGKVTAKSLYSQTNATATDAQILSGQTAWVNGTKITGKLGTKTTSFTRSTLTSLSSARNGLAGATVGNYALFAGGYTGSSYSSTVDAYDSSLTRSTPTGLFAARNGLVGVSTGNYALFAGGYTGSNNSSTVDAYNSSLTRSTPTSLSTARNGLAGASAGVYALFAGGFTGNSYSSKVDAYNSSLTRSTPTSLSTAKNGLAGTSVVNYALFAGGYNDISYNSKVDAYNSSLTRSTPTSLSSARRYLAGASIGNYALFAGGYTGSSSVSTVDSYDPSLTRSTLTELSTARNGLAGASVGNYALFAGGYTGNSSYSSTVDAYNPSLTRSTLTELSTARNGLAGARIGNYALFAGGTTSSRVSTVDAYERPHVSIPSQKIYL